MSKAYDILNELKMLTPYIQSLEDERERSKTVNKTVTLPNWLVEVGKEHNINFSQLLQKATREELNV